MSEKNLIASINEAKDMADDLSKRVHLYKEAILDPEDTISIPNINLICQLADELCNKLNQIVET